MATKAAKFTTKFDYMPKRRGKMISYEQGFEGDIPESHYDAAVSAGAIEAPAKAKAPPPLSGTGGAGAPTV